MSIASELERIKSAKQAIKDAVNAKGGTLTDERIDEYAEAITELSDGSSMDFYKCASVDTANKSWSGYKAVLTDGFYTFEENVTDGLSYTVITPATGKIYTADALCEIKKLYNGIPVDGLVFYAPLAEAKTTAETGQSIGSGGQYKVVKGIPCLWLDYDRVDVGMDNFPTGGDTYTASMWMCADYEQGYSEPVYAFIWGRDASGCNANFRYDPQTGYAYIAGGYDNQITSNEPVAGKWSHLLFTFDKGTFTAYQDGKLIGTSVNPNFDIGTAGARIGISLGGGHYYRGGVAAIRIYDRVLTDTEITKLSEEFTEHLNPVFYASLSKASSTAETGQALISRNVTYNTVDGIPCAYFDGNATIYMPDNDENILRLPRYKMLGTISLWFKSTAAQYASIMNYCGENRTARGIWLTNSGNITLNDGYDSLSDTIGFRDNVNHFNGNWCHALITYNSTTLKLYIDGIEKSSVDYELNTGAMRFGIGAWAWGHITHYFTGYVAAVRVYDRVVTAGEIQQLAGEFDI